MKHLPAVRRLAILAAGACAFCVLVLLNVGGYRFGASDQAFYIPVVLQGVDPELFPHFARYMAAQDQLFAFDDWLAPVLRGTGASVPVAFLAGYLLTLLLLYGAAVGIGCTLYRTWLSVAGLVAGLTLRHQILDTAVNTLEPYFHPRLMAFGLGLVAVALFLQWTQRPDVQAKLMSTGSIPLTESAYHEDSVKALDYAAANHYLLSGRVPEYDGEAAYRQAGEAHGVPRSYVDAVDPVTKAEQHTAE